MDISILKSFKLFYKRHALQRMAERNIDFDDIDIAFKNLKIIEEYPSDTPLPSFLAIGFDNTNEPIHFVMAIDYDSKVLYIITVYKPTNEKWSDFFTKRRKL